MAPARKVPPVHAIIWGGAAVGGLGLLLRWENGSAYSTAGYTKYELKYSDGSLAQRDYLPSATTTYTGPSNGLSIITLLPLLVAVGFAFAWRKQAWPRWGRFTLLGMAAFAALIGTTNGLFHGTMGPFLYLAGALAMGWGTIATFRRA